MEEKSLFHMRAEVIENFINLETIINAIISQHYLGRVHTGFFFEVLYDEYFSFGLKRRILEKIIPEPDTTQIQALNRINTIRNYFAHTGPEVFKRAEIPPKGQRGIVPDPRKLDLNKGINYIDLYKEFQELEPVVANYLFKYYTELGGRTRDEKG